MSSIANLQQIPLSEGVPPHPDPEATYKGPSMGWLMQNNKLAQQIIACHPDSQQRVLDYSELALLKAYAEDPSKSSELLEKYGNGGLVAFAVQKEQFDESERNLLRNWFASEDMKKEMEGKLPKMNGEGEA